VRGALGGDEDVGLWASMNAGERATEPSHNYAILARLNDNATISGARTEMAAVAARFAAERPDTHRAIGANVVPFDEQTVRAIKPALLVVAGGVALLLLVAAANATTLLLAP